MLTDVSVSAELAQVVALSRLGAFAVVIRQIVAKRARGAGSVRRTFRKCILTSPVKEYYNSRHTGAVLPSLRKKLADDLPVLCGKLSYSKMTGGS